MGDNLKHQLCQMEPNGLDLLLSINPIDVVGSSVVANSVPQILVEESYAVESSKDGSLKMKSSVVGSFDWYVFKKYITHWFL